MKSLKYYCSALTTILLLQSCSILYFGHNKEEWSKLSDEEKIAVKAEYQTVINSKKEQAHSDKINARTQSIIDYGVLGPNKRKPFPQ